MISVWEVREEQAPPDACRFCGGNDQHTRRLTSAVFQPHDLDIHPPCTYQQRDFHHARSVRTVRSDSLFSTADTMFLVVAIPW
jgi:hypothetical protein